MLWNLPALRVLLLPTWPKRLLNRGAAGGERVTGSPTANFNTLDDPQQPVSGGTRSKLQLGGERGSRGRPQAVEDE